MRIASASRWDLRSCLYDFCEGSEFRRGRAKAALFRDMVGRALFVAVGTGLDIRHFPPGRDIVGIDVSSAMLRKARPRGGQYAGRLEFVQADVGRLGFRDACFDTAVTSCTMCSVPQPIAALKEIHRVLRPGGRLLMFEHVRSRNPVLGLALDAMTVWSRLGGTEMNRDTVHNVRAAGFAVAGITSVYLDIILAVRAYKPKGVPGARRLFAGG